LPTLQASGLVKRYGKARAVAGLDLALESGQIVGLLGPNGAGKTTTLGMLVGAIAPSEGCVSIEGHDVTREPRAAKRHLGFVPQELAVYEDLSAEENLAFAAGLHGIGGPALRAAMRWALQVVGLTERARERVGTFSIGMRRRLDLAAGLVHRPKVLILDEPTVGVDPQSRGHIHETLRSLAQEGTSVLYASHQLDEIAALCDRVAIMDHGAILADGPPAALCAAHRQPDLDAVFFALTGSALRDGGST
jgi:ABC-2 type transport system ATP-binding protein